MPLLFMYYAFFFQTMSLICYDMASKSDFPVLEVRKSAGVYRNYHIPAGWRIIEGDKIIA
jgi:hypothetical protein